MKTATAYILSPEVAAAELAEVLQGLSCTQPLSGQPAASTALKGRIGPTHVNQLEVDLPMGKGAPESSTSVHSWMQARMSFSVRREAEGG